MQYKEKEHFQTDYDQVWKGILAGELQLEELHKLRRLEQFRLQREPKLYRHPNKTR